MPPGSSTTPCGHLYDMARASCAVYSEVAALESPSPSGRPSGTAAFTSGTSGRTLPKRSGVFSALGGEPGDGISRQPGFLSGQEDKELLLIACIWPSPSSWRHGQADGHRMLAPLYGLKRVSTGRWTSSGFVRFRNDRMLECGHPPQKLYLLCCGGISAPLSERELHDIQARSIRRYCFVRSTRPLLELAATETAPAQRPGTGLQALWKQF